MSLHLVDQHFIIFTHFVESSHCRGQMPQSIFSFISQNKISVNEAHILSFFPAGFHWNLERMLLNKQAKKWCLVNFILSFFQKLKRMQTKKFTVCQKQTKQVIKIFQHGFLEKGVKKQCWLSPPVQIQPETNLISEPLYFRKYSAIFGKPVTGTYC